MPPRSENQTKYDASRPHTEDRRDNADAGVSYSNGHGSTTVVPCRVVTQ